MKQSRKMFALLTAGLMTFSLCACGSNAAKQSSNTETTLKQEVSEEQTLQTSEMAQMPEGQAPEMSGERPQMPNGQAPEMNGEMPQMPNGQAPDMSGEMPQMPGGQAPGMNGGQPGGFGGGQFPGGQMQQGNAASAEEPSAIVTTDVENTAAALTADEAGAQKIVKSNAQVKIESAGTYLISGSCSDGNIAVKKGTTGVVLILQDLDLTSTTGATLSCNKGSEVKIIVRGDVKLTDAEDPADEESTDTEVADAFDGAALKVKDGANVCLTGDGTLTIDASSCKNGIKVGDENTPCFVIDGDLTINITAANDAVNGGYDVTILSGTLNIKAGDDALHADRILTLGKEDGTGPVINITQSKEGLEGTVVNMFGGEGSVTASDDAVNAANSDGTYSSEMAFSINITGGTWSVNSNGDGLDSNGNINITGGSTTIRSASNGGEAGLDYLGSLYVADGTLTNYSGVSFDSGQGGMGGPGGQMPGGHGGQMPGGTGTEGQIPGGQGTQPGNGGQRPGGGRH